jgi:hypothetical protein
MDRHPELTMQTAIMITISLHVLAGAFWAGSTFAVTRFPDDAFALRLFRPQMGAAVLAVVTGFVLWGLLHQGSFDRPEQLLALGVVAAIAAAAIQGISAGQLRRRLATGDTGRGPLPLQRLPAALLSLTIICMVIARFV